MRKLAVSTTMSRSSKPTPQVKKVAPPAVPEVYRHSGSSFGSTGYASSDDGGFLQPPDSPMVLSLKSSESSSLSSAISTTTDQTDGSSSGGSMLSKSPGVTFIPPNTFSFSARGEPLTHKAAVMYHQSLALQEDQGIDLTQSPGRDSPGSSNGSAGSGSRNSTASLDSGRASSYVTGTSSNRGASSPRYSVSSCSIGSVDRMSNRTDDEIVKDWLVDINFENYEKAFNDQCYDLATIMRMTPEDLISIGIQNPQDREAIKHHINALQLPDNLPNYVPGSIEEWLRLLRLENYLPNLLKEGYQTVCDVTQVAWEDLEEIGIRLLGHQKKFMLALKRVKDIISGKVPSPVITPHCQHPPPPQQQHQPPLYLSLHEVQVHQSNGQPSSKYQQHPQYILNPPQLYCAAAGGISDDVFVPTNYKQQLSLWNDQHLRSQTTHDRYSISGGCDEIHEFDDPDAVDCNGANENDVVLIKLRPPPGKTLDSIDDEQRISSHYTFNRHTMMPHEAAYYAHPSMQGLLNVLPMQYSGLINQNNAWRRSYDDGDITPTNENTICNEGGGGGTLPRHNRSNVNRNRPVAKVAATTIISAQSSPSSQLIMPAAEYAMPEKFKQVVAQPGGGVAQKCYGNHHCAQVGGGGVHGSPMMSKKHPPEPPVRRQCSTGSTVIDPYFDALTLATQQQQQHPHHHYQQQQVAAVHYAATQQQYPQYFNSHLPHNYQHYNNQPVYANFMPGGQHQTTTVEVHAEKIIDSKSNSSIDSIDQIPFANENAGTIKQRAMTNRQESSLTSLSSSSSSSSCSGASSKSTSSSASVTTTIAGNTSKINTLKASSTSPTTVMTKGDSGSNNTTATTTTATDLVVDTNVLNDIGNMLANLTDELDAMLEEEKRAGLNDSDEI